MSEETNTPVTIPQQELTPEERRAQLDPFGLAETDVPPVDIESPAFKFDMLFQIAATHVRDGLGKKALKRLDKGETQVFPTLEVQGQLVGLRIGYNPNDDFRILTLERDDNPNHQDRGFTVVKTSDQVVHVERGTTRDIYPMDQDALWDKARPWINFYLVELGRYQQAQEKARQQKLGRRVLKGLKEAFEFP